MPPSTTDIAERTRTPAPPLVAPPRGPAHAHPPRDGVEADLRASGSVGKALALLGAFSPEDRSLGVSEVARRADMPKSTVYRLLAVLVDGGLITKSGTKYSPGPLLTELAALANRQDLRRLREAALPYLLDLYEHTHQTVHLAVLEGIHVRYVEKIYGHGQVGCPSRVGGHAPAASTALGKAILAFSDAETVASASRSLRPLTPYSIGTPRGLALELRAIRERRVSYDRQENTLGLTCVGAPVLGWRGRVVAAVSVAGPVHRFRPDACATAVRNAAAGIGAQARHLF
ncbi:IclR family transcriptional regulator [Actinomadura chibensis]|uniref:IclR family transcriptional regulator n=1 Tax=Actinomadura chibensis TaxID=392828 RepID=A0A5D0N9R4_9ACTN|nr:IclR family transcriptional regulator [Actinomadura chibensis]TYB41056.1 IclR family transcriptional regulator [Actinomadura chibensis]